MLKRTDGYTDNRYYYDTDSGKFYISATSFCTAVLPENPYLVKWKQELGTFEAKRQSKIAALYGTLLHIILEDFLGQESYTMVQMTQSMDQFILDHDLIDLRSKWLKELKNDILSFAQFAYEKDIDPILMEQWAKKDITEYGGIAGTIDLECYIKWQRGKAHCLIDFKSGKKGFYDSHILQLHLYKEIVPCDLIFNWAPKYWQKETPTYSLTNQTSDKWASKLDHYLGIAELEGMFTPKIKKIHFDSIAVRKEPVFEIKGIESLIEEL